MFIVEISVLSLRNLLTKLSLRHVAANLELVSMHLDLRQESVCARVRLFI